MRVENSRDVVPSNHAVRPRRHASSLPDRRPTFVGALRLLPMVTAGEPTGLTPAGSVDKLGRGGCAINMTVAFFKSLVTFVCRLSRKPSTRTPALCFLPCRLGFVAVPGLPMTMSI